MKKLNGKGCVKVLAGILSVLLLVGCGAADVPEETVDEAVVEETAPEEIVEEIPEEIPEEETVLDEIPEETKGIEVQTEYFTFEYLKEWENKVEEVHTQEGRNSVVTFRTKVSERDVVLFSVILGPDEADGYLLGYLKDGEEMINVYAAVNDMPAEDWSEEEYQEICAMQERVNDIIVQFYEDERFVPNH